MQVKEINNKEEWENFFLQIPLQEKTFLNSWNWGEFNKSLEFSIWRIGIYEQDLLIAVALIIQKESENKIKKVIGRHLFIPHGPSVIEKFKPKTDKILKLFLDYSKTLARQQKANFIRINPIFPRTQNFEKAFNDLGFVNSPIFVHPEVTWLLDIQNSQDLLLAQMRKTTRYMIRQGEKNNILISQGNNIEDVEKYNKIYIETVKRQKFEPFSLQYLEKEFQAFNNDNQIKIFFANQDEVGLLAEALAEVGAMIIFWQGQAFYHQGASNIKNPKAGSAYLLQWNIIQEAKKQGCKIYNFWGIEEEIKSKEDINNDDVKKHPWWGLSIFKMGFGGERVEYLKTKDYPITFLYWPFSFYELIRRIKKGI